MTRAAVFHYVRFTRHLLWVSVLVGMNGCVTTITGGFNVGPSENEFLDNYIQLAVAYFDAGDIPNARRHLKNVLKIDSRYSQAYNILALISQREVDLELAMRLNRLEEAEVAVTRPMQLDSNLYTSSVELAPLRFQRVDWPGARQAFRQYLMITELYSLPHTSRALLRYYH